MSSNITVSQNVVDKLLIDAISKAAIKNTYIYGCNGDDFSYNEMNDSFKDGVKSDEAREYWRNYFIKNNILR